MFTALERKYKLNFFIHFPNIYLSNTRDVFFDRYVLGQKYSLARDSAKPRSMSYSDGGSQDPLWVGAQEE